MDINVIYQYVVGCTSSGLKGSEGQVNEGGHYKLIAQMAAAIGHNHGGSLWGKSLYLLRSINYRH